MKMSKIKNLIYSIMNFVWNKISISDRQKLIEFLDKEIKEEETNE